MCLILFKSSVKNSMSSVLLLSLLLAKDEENFTDTVAASESEPRAVRPTGLMLSSLWPQQPTGKFQRQREVPMNVKEKAIKAENHPVPPVGTPLVEMEKQKAMGGLCY